MQGWQYKHMDSRKKTQHCTCAELRYCSGMNVDCINTCMRWWLWWYEKILTFFFFFLHTNVVLQRAGGSVVGPPLLQEALDPSDPQQCLLPRGERPDHGHPGQLRLELGPGPKSNQTARGGMLFFLREGGGSVPRRSIFNGQVPRTCEGFIY